MMRFINPSAAMPKTDNRISQKLIRNSLLFVAILTCSISTWARQVDNGVADNPQVKVLTGATLFNGANCYTDFIQGSADDYFIQNIVSLRINEETGYYLTSNFTATVQLKIEYGPDANNLQTINSQNLTVSYNKDPRSKYDARNYFHFTGAKYVRITVLGISPASIGSINTQDLLSVENEIRAKRFYTLKNATASGFTQNSQDNELNVNWAWPSNAGYTHTQLEWTWVEDDVADYYKTNGVIDDNLLFTNNATRIDLPYGILAYKIPLLYGDAGHLYWRVRAVSMHKSGSRSDGAWSASQNYAYTGHEGGLNWQVTTSFAEEGKRKSVIQYFDGSLRGRQIVTKDNVTNTVAIGETMYDKEGRPAVQVLPFPATTTSIAYTTSPNLFQRNTILGLSGDQTNSDNPADFFDLEPIATPTSITPALLTSNGAAQYYSSSNPAKTDNLQKNIPDAEGYPYSVTRYTPDATGRIMAQSGVGAAMQMGKGHETRYYYSTVAQEELDGLFGTEAGNNAHYFKNMVRDANGQMSVSYVDMHGRIVATALAGEAPANLVKLDLNATHYPGQAATYVTRNLLNGNTNMVKNNSVEAINSLAVPAAGLYKFHYNLNPDSLSLPTCPGTSPAYVCYDCMYDLEFSITDESGDTPPVVKKYSNVSLNMDNDCTTPTSRFLDSSNINAPRSNIIDFSLMLQPGSYSVRKTLTISEASLQKFRDEYIAAAKQCTSLEFLTDSIINVLKTVTNCDDPVQPLTCDACLAEIGNDFNGFKAIYLAAGNTASDDEIRAAFNIAKQNCNRLCTTTSQVLTSKRQMMLSDMIPFSGQYAKDPSLVALPGSTYNKYDIFSTQNSGQPFYKAPWSANYLPTPYLTALNQPDPVNQALSGMSPAEFSQAFNYKWAEALLPHHPEYKKLVYAETNLASSYDWISGFIQVGTFSEAVSKNYILFNSNTTATPYNDPFYALNTGGQQAMVDMVATNYKSQNGITLSMWRIAYGEAKCKYIADLNTRMQCYANAPLQPSNTPGSAFDNLTAEEKDRAWVMFRTLYGAERDRLVNQYIQDHISDPTDAQSIVTEGYTLHFPTEAQQVQQSNTTGDWAWWPTTPGGEPNVIPGQQTALIVQQYNDRCEGYVPNWRAALLQCTTLSNRIDKDEIIDLITSQMVQVCKKGSDAANPYGSSTVPDNSPQDGSPRSFEDIITNVLATKGITKDEFCNPFVIEFPKPYGRTPAFIPEVISTIDTCTCQRFATIRQEATNAGYNANLRSSLNEYLWIKYKDTISQVLFSAFDNCSQFGTQVLCYTAYNTITHPCDQANPCGGGGEALRSGQQVKAANVKTDSTGSVTPLRAPDCGPGFHWDFALQECVSDDTPPEPCPIGYHWDFEQMICVEDDPQVCPPGYHWDAALQTCVQNAACQTACPYLRCDTIKTYSLALPVPQPLPAFLKCGYQAPQCFTCAELSALVGSFKSYFVAPFNSVPPFGDGNLSADQLKYNVLFQRFLNYKTGLTYSWTDYAKAAADAGCDLANYQSNTGASQTVICANSKPVTDTAGIILYNPPCQKIYNMASAMAQQIYESRINAKLADFEDQYRAHCLAAKDREEFTASDTLKEYHFTLYYYDQAGNLTKTVSPKGARPNFNKSFTDKVAADRLTNNIDTLPHTMATHYRYNSLNQVVMQYSPDGNVTSFWYDKLGRLVVSQNAQQAANGKYSYTLYDNLGRVTEVGQKPQTDAMTQVISQDPVALDAWINSNSNGGTKEQITFTVYDIPYAPLSGTYFTQQNLRNRVSYSATKKLATDNGHYTGTFYTYDVHGNVDTLLQDFYGVPEMAQPQERFKRIIYQHDLVSGKVNLVSYQPGQPDAFYHRYTYDAENRLTEVSTSRDSVIWQRDAAYNYYKHGPLARMELGDQRVQGSDYAYTLQGWLKGINTTNIGNVTFDMGKDGTGSGANSVVARDILGFALHYYDTVAGSDSWLDYKPIYGASAFARPGTASGFISLYNGNIGAISSNNIALGKGVAVSTNAIPLFYKYRYDALNRIVKQDIFKGLDPGTNKWAPVAIDDYKENITYDPNGNILTYNRNGTPSTGGPTAMDVLTYFYDAGSNKLNHVEDAISATTSTYAEDLETQGPGNYTYDLIGNLKTDNSEGITNVDWNIYGKITSITKGGNTITYTYDATGNRITKTVNGKTTIYVRDASGNVMSVYEKAASTTLVQKEVHLYGSSRLGMTTALTTASTTLSLTGGYGTAIISTFTRGEKVFEMTNHLGNVLATITDRKRQHSANGTTKDYYEADILTATDYYPFGMQMPGRAIAVSGCREEMQDAAELKVSSDLNSGVTQNGTTYTQNGVAWKPQASGIVTLNNQAIRVENSGLSGSDGVLAIVPLSMVEPFTTYQMECDITDQSAGITGYTIMALSQTGDPYRVSSAQSGLGHHTIVFSTGATVGGFLTLRISASPATAGLYFVVDNFTWKKLTAITQTQQVNTDFNAAVMSGVNVNDNGQLWKPFTASITTLSVTGTTDRKIQVNCTGVVNDSRLNSEFSGLTGGAKYLMAFTMGEPQLDKRLILSLYARTGTGAWTAFSQGLTFTGAGDFRYNFTLPAGVDQLKVEFIRQNTNSTIDGLDVPYTIDNFSLTLLDVALTKKVTICDQPDPGDDEALYRYGFNGKENDNEVKGEGNQQDYGMRIYDTRLGRFLSVDPKANSFPHITPYAAMNDNPLYYIDPTGASATDWVRHDGKMEYDSRVTDQKSAEELYGANAKWVAPNSKEASYKASTGEQIVLKEDGNFTSNGVSKKSADQAKTGNAPSSVFANTIFVVGITDFSFGLFESGYDHLNYRTTSGELMRIRRANGSFRSARAQTFGAYSTGVKGTALGLSLASNILTAAQIHDQYVKGGFKNINPLDATSLTIGTTGMTANGLSWAGFGGTAMSTVGQYAGYGGLAIQTYQNWMQVYQPWINLTTWRPTTGSAEGDMIMQAENDMGIYKFEDYFK